MSNQTKKNCVKKFSKIPQILRPKKETFLKDLLYEIRYGKEENEK